MPLEIVLNQLRDYSYEAYIYSAALHADQGLNPGALESFLNDP